MLVTGDLEDVAIHDLIRRYPETGPLDVDVYVVGHHGSINGMTKEPLDAMTPQIAFIKVGSPNHQAQYCALQFGHPRAEAIETLDASLIQRHAAPNHAQVGKGSPEFEKRAVSHAIY